MTISEIALPVLHKKQAYIDKHAARFNMMCCGARFGKDILMMRRLIKRTQTMQYQGWIAPTYRMMTENYKEIKNRLAPIVQRQSASEHVLELVNGSVIDFWSLENFNAIRGRKYHWATINECATSPNLQEAWTYVIRPRLADYKGGADLGSTPKGLNGFYTLWNAAEADKEWRRFHYTTYDNPYIPREEIDAMKNTLPDRVFKQEIMAEFVENGAFFQNIDPCCTIQAPDNPENHKGHRFTAGLDWGLTTDFTRLTVGCATCAKVVDWWGGNKMDYNMQRGFIVAMLKKWPGVQLLPERNSMGGPNIEELARNGIMIAAGPDGAFGYMTTSVSKTDLIMGLALVLQKQEFQFPAEYADEFRAYEVEMTTAHPKFSAPKDQHDDRVISAALMIRLATVPIQVFI